MALGVFFYSIPCTLAVPGDPVIQTVSSTLTSTGTRFLTTSEKILYDMVIKAAKKASDYKLDYDQCTEDSNDQKILLDKYVQSPPTVTPTWVPWVVAGSGVVGLILGVYLTAQLSSALQ